MSWMNIGVDYFQSTYSYSHKKANTYLMIPYVIGSVVTPIFGLISDHIGHRGQLLFISTVMLILSHYIFGWQHLITSVIPLIGLGISYSIFCAVIWPSFAQVVDDKCVGTAYGIPTSFYNLINSVGYIIVGALTKHSNIDQNKYVNVEWFLLSLSLFSGISILLLIYFDSKTGHRLKKPVMGNKM